MWYQVSVHIFELYLGKFLWLMETKETFENKTKKFWEDYFYRNRKLEKILTVSRNFFMESLQNYLNTNMAKKLEQISAEDSLSILFFVLKRNLLTDNEYGLKTILRLFSKKINLSYLMNPHMIISENPPENMDKKTFMKLWGEKIIPLVKEVMSEKEGKMGFKSKTKKKSRSRSRRNLRKTSKKSRSKSLKKKSRSSKKKPRRRSKSRK